jgi:F-type H+-transporting ATPase subunit b
MNFWLLAAETAEAAEETPNPLIPEPVELIVGALAFLIVLAILWRFAFPAMNRVLAERTEKIQGNLEKAEHARGEAEQELARYREQLAGARDEANRIIEEARKMADQLRRDLQAKAEQESAATVARAQEEIRAERDRVLQELRTQVGTIAVDLAGRVVGESLDKKTHERLIDEYIDEVAASGTGREAG